MNFIKKIFSPIILIISIFLLVYIFFKSEIYSNESNKTYYLKYYIIVLTLIFFSIVSFFINQKIKEYIIISFISILISLYLLEGYLTYYKPFLKRQVYEKKFQKNWDKRSKLEVYYDFKKSKNNATLAVLPKYFLDKNYKIFPLSGVSESETILCNEDGFFSTYQSDRYGFNNPDTEWNNEKIEYILIGDSFTHGYCVNRPNDIGSVLRTLSNKSVLNLGQGGNGPLTEYATLREYLDKRQKKVIWIYYEENDLRDLENEMKNKFLNEYLNNLDFTQNLKSKQNEIDNIAKNLMKKDIIKKKNYFLNIINFLKIKKTRILYFSAVPNKPEPSLEFKKIVQLTNELVKKNNSKLFFVYLPEYNRYATPYNNKNYNLIKNIINELNIHFIDIPKLVFEKETNQSNLFSLELVHYNAEGYKKVAETIYRYSQD